MVAELVLVDDCHHSFRVSIWGDAYDLLKDVSRGEGISLVGLTAMKDSRDDGCLAQLLARRARRRQS